MERLDINGICIKSTSESNGLKIIEFFKNNGILNDDRYIGDCIGAYYFAKEGIIRYSYTKPEDKKVINPWIKPRRKFPREMRVSIDKVNWVTRTVLGKIKTEYPYITDGGYIIVSWKYAKEID